MSHTHDTYPIIIAPKTSAAAFLGYKPMILTREVILTDEPVKPKYPVPEVLRGWHASTLKELNKT